MYQVEYLVFLSIVRTNFDILHVYSWCKSVTFWLFKVHFLDWLVWPGTNRWETNNISFCRCWPSGLWNHVDLLLGTNILAEHLASMFQVNTASHLRRPTSTYSPPWELKSQGIFFSFVFCDILYWLIVSLMFSLYFQKVLFTNKIYAPFPQGS